MSIAFGLEEVGDPYMTLRTAMEPQPGGAVDACGQRIGAVRVWQPPSLNRLRPHTVEKLVYLHLRTELIAAQWIFGFSAAASLVPHFGASSPRARVHVRTRDRVAAQPF